MGSEDQRSREGLYPFEEGRWIRSHRCSGRRWQPAAPFGLSSQPVRGARSGNARRTHLHTRRYRGHFRETGSIVALSRVRWLVCRYGVIGGFERSPSPRCSVSRQHKDMRAISGLDETILKKLALEAGNVFEKIELIKTLEERRSLKLSWTLSRTSCWPPMPCAAQNRNNLSEYAGLIGRFAAALSHELNSPLGTLKNALQTSRRLAERKQMASGASWRSWRRSTLS